MKKIILSAILIGAIAMPAFAQTVKIGVNGLVCSFCARGVEEKFKQVEGVNKVDVNLDNKLVTLDFAEGKNIEDKKITEILEEAGYNVTKIER